jgi:hypothetical protein
LPFSRAGQREGHLSSRVYQRRHWRRSDCKDIAHVISSGLRIINVANPAAPTEAGFYDTPGDAYGVALARNYAYVADGGGGLRIVNIANPAAPTEVGFYDTPGWAYGVALAGNYAYVTDGHGGLLILGETHRLFLPMVTRTM